MKFTQTTKCALIVCFFCLLVFPVKAFSTGIKVATISLQDVLTRSQIGQSAQQQLQNKAAADKFLSYLQTEGAQDIYAKYGFLKAKKEDRQLKPL